MLLGVPWEPQWSPCGAPAVCLGTFAAPLPSGLGALDAIWAELAPLVRFSGVVWGALDAIWAEPGPLVRFSGKVWGARDAIWAEPAPLLRFSGVVWGAPDTIWAEPVVGLGRRGGSGERGWDVSGG